MSIIDEEKRELRVLNRNFSLGEYGESWTKLERYLFIEVYNVIKNFYLARSSFNIKTFSAESILLTLPVDRLDKKLFKANQKKRDLLSAAEGLSKKQIRLISITRDGEHAFDFISIFPRITYDPGHDKKNMYVRIQSEVYEQMVPIESYCQLDLKLLSEFNSGNTVRLYEIFKSYAYRKTFEIGFDELRKKLGFFHEGHYQEWKHFNAKVLKPSVRNINHHKHYDIEVFYEKPRGLDQIEFRVTTHQKQNTGPFRVLNLNEAINETTRELNLIQKKYIETAIMYCQKAVEITNVEEITGWIVSDLIAQQNKQGDAFDFKHAMNAISKQIREGDYTRPYAHKHLHKEEGFNVVIYEDIKALEQKGFYEEIKDKYTDQQIEENQFGFILNSQVEVHE